MRYFNRYVSLYCELESTSITIDNLKIAFDFSKKQDNYANKGTITISNLAPSTRDMFFQKATRPWRISLDAGYKEGVIGLLCTGEITKVEFKGQITTDLVLSVEDGRTAIKAPTINETLAENTTNEDVLRRLAKELPVSNSTKIEFGKILKEKKIYKRGITLSGEVGRLFDQYCKDAGLIWSIQDNSLQVCHKEHPVDTILEVLKITPSSGLIGSPNKVNIATFGSIAPNNNGATITTLLDHRYLPGRRVIVESERVNGAFVIREVKHSGDSFDGSFISELLLEESSNTRIIR